MRYVALAVDYDGTLAASGRVAPETLRALERLKSSGRKVILVTGRELDDLIVVFPELEVCDRVVAENGAVLYSPGTGTRRVLGDPPAPALVRELRRRGVQPLSVGRSIVATVHPHETIVLETIRDLGLELNVIFNKGAVMILPASLNKASGLEVALADLGLSPRNVAAIGDAENDHALLRAAEFGVAVANALPALREEADRVSRYDNGRAVIELVDDLLGHDLHATPPRTPRRDFLVGVHADGRELRIPSAGCKLLIAGGARHSRSQLATGLLRQIAAAGYQFCALGAAGEFAGVPGALALGAAGRAPAAEDVAKALQKPDANVWVDVGGMPEEARPMFVAGLMHRMAELGACVGRPHWVLIDDAELSLPSRDDTEVVAEAPSGMICLTAGVEPVDRRVLANLDFALVFGENARATLASVAAAWGAAAPDLPPAAPAEGEVLAWRRDSGGAPVRIRLVP